MLGIALTHSNPEAKEEFVNLVRTTLSRLAADGLDEKLVLAAVNSKEFELREADFTQYPKGLTYNMEVMKAWLYDGLPSTYLEYEAALTAIREQCSGRYFERLIETYLLNSNHCSVVVLQPSQTLAGKRMRQSAAVWRHTKRLWPRHSWKSWCLARRSCWPVRTLLIPLKNWRSCRS